MVSSVGEAQQQHQSRGFLTSQMAEQQDQIQQSCEAAIADERAQEQAHKCVTCVPVAVC